MDKKSGGSFMQKVAAVIVDRKTFFFLAFIVMAIFCVFSRNWVNVNDDITSYLAKDTETRRGLDIMESEFTTFATANVMVSSITYDAAEKLAPKIGAIDGVRRHGGPLQKRLRPLRRHLRRGHDLRGQREGHGRDKVPARRL